MWVYTHTPQITRIFQLYKLWWDCFLNNWLHILPHISFVLRTINRRFSYTHIHQFYTYFGIWQYILNIQSEDNSHKHTCKKESKREIERENNSNTKKKKNPRTMRRKITVVFSNIWINQKVILKHTPTLITIPVL